MAASVGGSANRMYWDTSTTPPKLKAGDPPPAASTVVGTTTNDNAAAGIVGEYIQAQLVSGSAVTLTTNTPANVIATLSLTAGDWDVDGVVDFIATTATSVSTSPWLAGSSTVSATLGGQDTASSDIVILTAQSSTFAQDIPTQRFSLAATTTVYLVAQATFSAGTVKAYGTIRARRAR